MASLGRVLRRERFRIQCLRRPKPYRSPRRRTPRLPTHRLSTAPLRQNPLSARLKSCPRSEFGTRSSSYYRARHRRGRLSVSARMAEATRNFFGGVTRARASARTIPDSVPAKAETISLAEAPHAPPADTSPEHRPAQEEPAVGPTEVVPPIPSSERVQAASTEPGIAEVGPSVSARMAEATRNFFSRTRRLRASVRTQPPDSTSATAETKSPIDAPQEETSAVAAMDASEAASLSPTQAPTLISEPAVGVAASAGASDLGASETGPSIPARLSRATRNFLDVLSRALRSARPGVPDSAPAKTTLTSLGDAPQEEMPFASSLAAPAPTPTPTLSSTPAPTPAPPPTVPPADASAEQSPAEEATYFVDVLRALLSARTQLDSTPAKTETTWPTDAPREEAPVAPSATPAQASATPARAPAPIFTAPDQVQKRAASPTPTPAAAVMSAGIPPAEEPAGPAEAIRSALDKLDWPDNVTISSGRAHPKSSDGRRVDESRSLAAWSDGSHIRIGGRLAHHRRRCRAGLVLRSPRVVTDHSDDSFRRSHESGQPDSRLPNLCGCNTAARGPIQTRCCCR